MWYACYRKYGDPIEFAMNLDGVKSVVRRTHYLHSRRSVSPLTGSIRGCHCHQYIAIVPTVLFLAHSSACAVATVVLDIAGTSKRIWTLRGQLLDRLGTTSGCLPAFRGTRRQKFSRVRRRAWRTCRSWKGMSNLGSQIRVSDVPLGPTPLAGMFTETYQFSKAFQVHRLNLTSGQRART